MPLEFSNGYDVRSVPAGASRVTITAADGFALAAQTFGNAATCRAGVLLVGACAWAADARAECARVDADSFAVVHRRRVHVTREDTESMHGFYATAPRELRRIALRDIGVSRIGHFGFFREHYAQHLWPLTAAWFHQFVH